MISKLGKKSGFHSWELGGGGSGWWRSRMLVQDGTSIVRPVRTPWWAWERVAGIPRLRRPLGASESRVDHSPLRVAPELLGIPGSPIQCFTWS